MLKKILGIELGSTRIKAVLIDEKGSVLAQGGFEWENQLKNGLWTYSLEDVWKGIQCAYQGLCKAYSQEITSLDGIGISAMMHGYLAFDQHDQLLVPFRTWRNTNTQAAAEELSEALDFNMPQRWSATHYYQAVLNGEEHVPQVRFLTTLAGYVHWQLAGEKVLGVGDASGMFPILDGAYDGERLSRFDGLLQEHGIVSGFLSLLPKVLSAGECAGRLTESGAKRLDPTGTLQAGATFCPPEGDAGTGMVATNAVKVGGGNVSAGTSAFAMIVMEKPLSKAYPEIDVVTTPDGKPVAMVHVNNFTSELNVWARMFEEVAGLLGANADKGMLFERLFEKSLEADEQIGGLVGYNYHSGEPIVGLESGRPLFARTPDGKMTLANFMKMQIYSALGALSLGMEILKAESVQMNEICGHGGFFKTQRVAAPAMSAALNAPVTVMKNAGEGGAWGIAVLALYTLEKTGSLSDFLAQLFGDAERTTYVADEQEKKSFAQFMHRYKQGLALEKLSTEIL